MKPSLWTWFCWKNNFNQNQIECCTAGTRNFNLKFLRYGPMWPDSLVRGRCRSFKHFKTKFSVSQKHLSPIIVSKIAFYCSSHDFCWNFRILMFFRIFQQKTRKYVNFEESCTGAVQSLHRKEKMSDKFGKVLKTKLECSTYKGLKFYFH